MCFFFFSGSFQTNSQSQSNQYHCCFSGLPSEKRHNNYPIGPAQGLNQIKFFSKFTNSICGWFAKFLVLPCSFGSPSTTKKLLSTSIKMNDSDKELKRNEFNSMFRVESKEPCKLGTNFDS